MPHTHSPLSGHLVPVGMRTFPTVPLKVPSPGNASQFRANWDVWSSPVHVYAHTYTHPTSIMCHAIPAFCSWGDLKMTQESRKPGWRAVESFILLGSAGCRPRELLKSEDQESVHSGVFLYTMVTTHNSKKIYII